MICTKCGTLGVENQANGNTFYFCRTCRDEIRPEEKPAAPNWDDMGGIVYVNENIAPRGYFQQTPRLGSAPQKRVEDCKPGDKVRALQHFSNVFGDQIISRGRVYEIKDVLSDGEIRIICDTGKYASGPFDGYFEVVE